MWDCDFDDCQKRAVRVNGQCILCDHRLCSAHLKPEFHKCPHWKDSKSFCSAFGEAEKRKLTALMKRIDVGSLASRASQLRNGIPCSISNDGTIDKSLTGGMNYHIEIRFEDDVRWLARIRKSNAASPPPELRDLIMRSEIATLQFLEKTQIPAPKVFGFDFEGKHNPVGVGYMLLEKLPGKSMSWSTSSEEQKRKVITQLVDLYVELQKFPFERMGSLDRLGAHEIGPFAQGELADYSKTGLKMIGPCSSLEEYYRAFLELTLDLILREECYTDRPVDGYLIHRFLLDSLPAVVSSRQGFDDGLFYLKHADDKGDHILIDDEFNITGIIDWEWAYTAPKSLAFNSPTLLLPVAEFYDSNTNLGEHEVIFAQVLEDKGHQTLANIVRSGRVAHFFEFCGGYPGGWEDYVSLFQGLRNALGVHAELDWDGWKKVALEQYKDDERLKVLLARSESN